MTTYGRPYTYPGNNWYVEETGDDGITVRIHIADEHDTTAGEHNDYNARCAACWLGHAHSARVHADKLRCASK